MPAREVYSPEDVIQPSKLEHLFDEGFLADTSELIFRYNFLRYEFAHPNGAIWARSYLDETDHVAIYPPKGVGLDDEIVKRVIAYLGRRYGDIRHLTKTRYASLPHPKRKI